MAFGPAPRPLLPTLLARVNARTTLIPLPRVDNDSWKIDLTTWDSHELRKSQTCGWSVVSDASPDVLKYKWEHLEEWAYRHESSNQVANGTYTTSCE